MIVEYVNFIKDYIELSSLKLKSILYAILFNIINKGITLVIPFVAALIVKYLTVHNTLSTYYALIIFVVLFLINQLFEYVNFKIYTHNCGITYYNLINKFFSKFTSVDKSIFYDVSKGKMLNSLGGDLFKVIDMNLYIPEVVGGIIQLFIVIVLIFLINPVVGLILIMFAVFYIIIRNDTDRAINKVQNKIMYQEDKYGSLVAQMITGLGDVNAFNMYDALKDNFTDVQSKFAKSFRKERRFLTIRDCDIDIVTYVFKFILYVVSIFFLINHRIDISLLVLIISYYDYILEYLESFFVATIFIRECSTSMHRLNEMLNYETSQIEFGNLDLNDISGAIKLKNVSYEHNGILILDDINLAIKKNEFLVITGETGSGKTTLFNLLLRIYKPSSGQILLDNTDIFSFSKKIYKNNISIANSKPFIFNASIRKNLDFIDTDIEAQIAACKKVGVHEYIEKLPNGYQTILRENGSNLSAGQKQLLSIARTILSKAEIILFDDITAQLDPQTRSKIPDLISNLKKNHTIILITKDPYIMKNADRIVVLNKGKIEAIGKHEKLLKKCGVYQSLQYNNYDEKI